MGKSNFSDDFKRDAVAQITERGLSSCAGVAASGCKPAFPLCVEEEVRAAIWRRRPGCRDPAAEARTDPGYRGARHCKEGHRVLRQRCKVRYAFVAEHRPLFSVRAMCRCLRIHPSGFYAWLKNPLSRRAREDAHQIELIRKAWKDSGKVYGYRKLHDDLLDQGETCCPNRVARLVRLAGIKAQIGYKRRPGSYGGKPSAIVDNTLDQQFDVEAPDRVWVTDITYIRTHEGFAYLAVVIDLYSRRVVGWSMQSRQTTDVVLQALLMAVWRRKPKNKVLIHSDQGSQFTSMEWASFLRAHHLEHSMSRRGNCHDNAVAESFFNLLKRERIRRRTYKTRAEARQDVFDYIEMFYNPKRKHVRNGML